MGRIYLRVELHAAVYKFVAASVPCASLMRTLGECVKVPVYQRPGPSD